jgi:PD-(D/E)XK endonuclease
MLTTDQKGAIAEMAIAWEATKQGIEVYRPIAEGGRFDMIFLLGDHLARVQCKWAPRLGDAILVRCYSCRRVRKGHRRRRYTASEIDAIAAYCPDNGRCYYLPIEWVGERRQVLLRVAPTQNNQELGIQWADDFEFAATLPTYDGAIAQLGERLDGIQKVAGSSPAGSTLFPDEHPSRH